VKQYKKDPQAVLDYVWDWAADAPDGPWLAPGETITAHVITADEGITIDSTSLLAGNQSVLAWLSGGTAGAAYMVTCQITTNQNRTDHRSILVKVTNR
jgi:hypothetical protein